MVNNDCLIVIANPTVLVLTSCRNPETHQPLELQKTALSPHFGPGTCNRSTRLCHHRDFTAGSPTMAGKTR